MPVIDAEKTGQEIREFIVDSFLFGSNAETFSNADSFMQKGILDSTGVLELTSFLEEKFGITVEDSELVPDNLDSVDRIVQYLHRKKS